MHQLFGRGEITAVWQAFHAPLIALGVSALFGIAAWRLRSGMAAFLAGGAAIIVGWWVMIRAPLALAPHSVLDRLALISVATLVIALAAERLMPRRGVWPPLVLIAVGCAWWLAGGPRTEAGLLADWKIELATVIAVIAVTRLCGVGSLAVEPLRPAMAAVALAIGLHVAGAPWVWIVVALVPAAAVIPLVMMARLPPLALLPVTANLAAAKVAISLSLGRLAHGTLTAVDAAALSPLVALWMFPLVSTRLRPAGRIAPLLAAVLCGAVAVALVWGVMRLRRL